MEILRSLGHHACRSAPRRSYLRRGGGGEYFYGRLFVCLGHWARALFAVQTRGT